MTLWTANDAAAATGGTAHGDWAVTGVSIDTRTLEDGDLFVALKAARDGHDFVAQALENGAAAALVSRIPESVAPDAPLLIVEDVQTALEALGRAGRARCQGRVVAVTGSVGKTSTKEMLLQILSEQGKTHASVASYNNHWGVPLTLARMPRDTEYAVIEIGMNHPGEIAPLARMARPHVALITTVAAAHLEAFPNVEAIAVEKASILEGLEPDGVAVLNNDVAQAAILMAKAVDEKVRDVGFGEHGFDFILGAVSVKDGVTVAEATVHGAPLIFKLGTEGRHFAMNGLGALAAAEALGADLALAAQALGRWSPYRGRGVREVVCLDPIEPDQVIDLIDDAYNANPTSVAAALDVLACSQAKRRVAILGDMKELGPQQDALHAGLADLPAMESIDIVHCIGPLMRALHDALPEQRRGLSFDTSADMTAALAGLLQPGDSVLVKGSLSMQLGRVVDAIRKMGHGDTGLRSGSGPAVATADKE